MTQVHGERKLKSSKDESIYNEGQGLRVVFSFKNKAG